jgi:hypothetical protein
VPKRPPLTETILGEHLKLCVAAHLARTQLVPDPRTRYDGQHLLEMVEAVAEALTRVATVYVRDRASAAPRELSPAELEGAAVRQGANLLVLRDGRTFSTVSIKRADLRQAIAILKAVGSPWPQRKTPQVAPAQPAGDLPARLAEIEAALPNEVERANRLLIAVARSAPDGRVANRAMQLMSALAQADTDAASVALAQLRAAVQEFEGSKDLL